ncbi:MAG: TIGR01777 family oxidoreductase [Actinobacteria bacterium]|nr:TIGR01777 family oxidoreductase [Actinomycetota bacterium]
MKIAVTGSSGLIGSALVKRLTKQGHQVIRLVRRSPIAEDEIRWIPDGSPLPAESLSSLSGTDAVIHLAGAGVGDKRWSAAYKNEILKSRTESTTTIVSAINELEIPRFLSASAIGWYGETGNREVTEEDRAGDDFLADVCRQWEESAGQASAVTTLMRTGLVFAAKGGALGRMVPLFKAGLGGKLGDGNQWWSWISLNDEIRAIDFLLNNELAGPVNLTSPFPATNSEVTAALARALHRPALFPAPAFAIKVALGGFSTEVLGSKRVAPTALLQAGFTFENPHIGPALEELVD